VTNRWSGALQRAFQAHLKMSGSGGSGGSAVENRRAPKELSPPALGTTSAALLVPVVLEVSRQQAPGTTGTTDAPRVVPDHRSQELQADQELSASGTTGTTGTSNIGVVGAFAPMQSVLGPAPVEVLRDWSEGLRRLDVARPPPDFSPEQWRQLIGDGETCLAAWGREAARLGWSGLDLFGAHPIAPAARYDLMGLVPLIRGHEVVAMDVKRATTRARSGNLLTYLRRPMAGAVLLWELA